MSMFPVLLCCVQVVDEASVENVKLTKKRSQKKGIGHVRPDVTMLAKERQLVKIATRGGVWEGDMWEGVGL